MLPPGGTRTLLVPALGAGALAASTEPQLPVGGAAVLVVLASVAAWATRSSLILLRARRGLVVIDPRGRPHRLGVPAGVAAALGAAAGAVVATVPLGHAPLAVLLACVAGMAMSVLLTRADTAPRAPRRASLLTWLVIDTAVPAGFIAAAFGGCVAVLRLQDAAHIGPEVLGRHMAGTTFLYAVLLGTGGFSKAWTEQARGLVLVERTTLDVPGPVLVGLVIGVAQLFVVPVMVPAVVSAVTPTAASELTFPAVLGLKMTMGFVVGGALSLLGAIRGARHASSGAI